MTEVDQNVFEADLAESQRVGFRRRIEDSPPIGMLPNGKPNFVNENDLPFVPTVVRKIERDAFLYMEDPDQPDFAQCGTCWLFHKDAKRCGVLPEDFEVNAEDSCGYYLEGRPADISCPTPVRPEDVGFVKATKVRCENCEYGGDECALYKHLNEAFPSAFDLDIKIDPRGCCNAFQSSK